MKGRSKVFSWLGAAVLALTVSGVVSPTTSAATGAATSTGKCTGYAGVAKTPRGFIPRDDFQIVKKDPLAQKPASSITASSATAAAFAPTEIPVVFHVISKDPGHGGGNLSKKRIQAQIDVLNNAYADADFSFHLTKITRTVQPRWFNMIPANGADPRLFRGSGKEIKMKRALHEGDAETLNLYTASLGQFLLGWAYLPWDFDGTNGEPLPRFFDGVVMDFRSLPQVQGDT